LGEVALKERVRARWFCGIHYCAYNAFHILHDVVVPKMHDPISERFNLTCSLNVLGLLQVMLTPIKLDHQARFKAKIINDKSANAKLAFEFKAFNLTISYAGPKLFFGRCLIAAQ
jgi:hypothetical protein